MKIKKKYQGVIVPVVTPLTANHKLDVEAVEKIFANLHRHDAMPFILGTTGESASLSNTVTQDYIANASKLKTPGTQLYAGISSNCFEDSVEFAKQCFQVGVDAVAATLPSYYNLTEDNMKRYFEQLADQIPCPLIIYNIPATTHMSIPLEVIDELSYHENIVGTKDSERSEERLDKALSLWSARKDFGHFLGWAAKSAYALIDGSDGLIPSTGNLHPGLYYEMAQAVSKGDFKKAYDCQRQSDLLGNLYQAGRTLGESLWALKVLMQEYGFCEPNMMPPLQGFSKEEAASITLSLQQLINQEGIQLNIPLSHV